MKRGTVLVCMSMVLAGAGRAGAQYVGRCLDYAEADILWCDDFDNYCVNGETWTGYPPLPAKCAVDGSAVPDDTAFLANWVSECNQNMGVFNGYNTYKVINPPFSAVYLGTYETDPIEAKFHTWSLTAAIQARDSTKNAVNGSDANPLVLEFWTWHAIGDVANSPVYLELSLDGDHAPTDYAMRDCTPEGQGPFPIICQQNRAWARAKAGEGIPGTVPNPTPDIDTICPPLEAPVPGETYVRRALAYGMLALMDAEPCNVETARRPTMYHAVVFDGVQWMELRENRFPPGMGDFSLDGTDSQGNNTDDLIRFKMEIKSTSMIVHQRSTLCPDAFPCWATVPRQYTGPFNMIAMGTAPGCELDPATGDCKAGSTTHCFDYITADGTDDDNYHESWKHTYVDSPVVVGGDLLSLSGACCLPNLSCQDDTIQADCEALGGEFQGLNTTCAETLCCHTPFADGDGDGDVDQADFGLWQTCYDGGNGLITGCECYDRDGDSDVDGADFTEFANCFTGANVSFSAGSFPSCNP